MNDPYRYPWGPQNNETADFLDAWRHVVDRFRAAGADNVVWIWSPHLAYANNEDFYPGDAYVDWVATGVLNYGTVANWSQWWTFDQIFGQRYARFARLGKPIMIAELGSLEVGGNRAKWFADALNRLPQRYPAVKGLLFFHVAADQTVTYQALDWSFLADSATVAATRAALAGW
jgi:beta-mannanase